MHGETKKAVIKNEPPVTCWLCGEVNIGRHYCENCSAKIVWRSK